MKYRYILIYLLFILGISNINAQLSFLTVMDSFPGSASEFVPIPEGFITMNGSFEDNEAYAFRMSKFSKCGAIEWTKEYKNTDPFFNEFGSPEAVMGNDQMIYLLMASARDQAEGSIFLKLSQSGDIQWSYLLHGTQSSSKTSLNNIHYNKYTDTLSVVLNNELDHAMVIQFNTDGEILAQKQYPGFRFHSSQIGSDGSIIMANDTAIVKIDDQLELVWAKKLDSHSNFVQSNDPIVELNGQINLMAVDTFGNGLDSFYYSLITLDEDGLFVSNSDGIRGVDFGSVDLQQRGTNKFLFLDRNLGTTIEGNTSLIASQLDYAFCADTIPYCTSNINTCIDNSLLMSGFYYEKPDSIQFFMGKTDPTALLNCHEKTLDSLDTKKRSFVEMDSIFFEAESYSLIQDTIILDDEEFLPEQTEICFTAIVEEQSNEYQPCPCEEQPLAVSWLKGADYLWSTGDSTSFITVNESGDYSVEVDLCGTIVTSDFKVTYKDLTQCMIFENNTPQCPGVATSLRVIHDYGSNLDLQWSTEETGDSIRVFKSGTYTVSLAACGYTDNYSFDVVYKDLENEECKPVQIPNAFVPGSSTYEDNKVFKIYTILDPQSFTSFRMEIFDRWGEKVFETTDPFTGWNGTYKNKNMPPGVYLYGISYQLELGGELYEQSHQGQVLLVK